MKSEFFTGNHAAQINVDDTNENKLKNIDVVLEDHPAASRGLIIPFIAFVFFLTASYDSLLQANLIIPNARQ